MSLRLPIPQELSSSSSRSLTYIPTVQAYDRWAASYDTDANPLQALDDLELATLLPEFLSLIPERTDASTLHIVDLGCGTGRNTIKLLSLPNANVLGLDASSKMLDIARERCATVLTSIPDPPTSEVKSSSSTSSSTNNSTISSSVSFAIFDMLSTDPMPTVAYGAHALLSTLVAEHIPLPIFFRTIAAALAPEGLALVTNMHEDMGARSQAGFVDVVTGEKVRPVSYAHTVAEVLQEAERAGLSVVGKVREREVDEDVVGMLGRRAGKWIGVKCWMGVVLRKGSYGWSG